MTRKSNLKARILAYLQPGERTDLDVYLAMAPTPARTVERALLALRNGGQVQARQSGTMLRLA